MEYKVAGKTYEYDSTVIDKNKSERVSFAFVNGIDDIIVQEPGDKRPIRFLMPTAMKDSEFELVVRGVFDANNIILFTGTHYGPVKDVDCYLSQIQSLRNIITERFGFSYNDIAIWNGVIVGEIGEKWKPFYLIGIMASTGEVELF